MTMPRRQLVDVDVTRYYHCISRCVRRACLCGEGYEHRKQWIEDRLELLADCFALSVCGFAVLDNHLHLLVRLDPHEAATWSDEEVVRRWIKVYPPKTLKGDEEVVNQAWIAHQLRDAKKVTAMRQRLANLGWFMKALKEPLARIANQEDGCRGTFWESRYKSIAILDEEALLATCAYIDLNPVAAGVAKTPETSPHTSIRQRVQHATERGKLKELKAAPRNSLVRSPSGSDFEQEHWLCPLEDRHPLGAPREGMLESFTLRSYLLLVDYTSRLCRQGKARVSGEVASILDRLGTSGEIWSDRMKQLFARRSRLPGTFFASTRQRLQTVASARGVHHLDNFAGCRAA